MTMIIIIFYEDLRFIVFPYSVGVEASHARLFGQRGPEPGRKIFSTIIIPITSLLSSHQTKLIVSF